jgi:Ser/Thr protein kinase RdoA (MazF antagonist)
VVNTAILERLLSQARKEVITGYTTITIGVSNDAYVVTCESGHRYVIRVLDEQTVGSAEAEARIQQAMSRHGMSTPVYLPLSDGRFVGRDSNDAFTVAAFIEGEHPETATLGLVTSLGAQMARLHNVLDPNEIQLGYNTGQWLDERNIEADLARCDPAVVTRIRPIVDQSVAIFDRPLPMAIVHGELATNNVFAAGDEVTTIFDFETAQHGPRILDLAFSYLSFVYDGDIESGSILRALVEGYSSKADLQLTTEEVEAFGLTVRFVSAAAATWSFARDHADYGEQFLAAGEATIPPLSVGWLDYLERYAADETPHSGRHLLDHLTGTEALLRTWGAPEHVCRAGLMHSVYGTEAFGVQTVPLDRRDEVRALIGHRAERIAYLFGAMTTESFFDAASGRRSDLIDRASGTSIPISDDELAGLCHVAVANWLEQEPFIDAAAYRELRRADYLAMIPVLSERAGRAVLAAYGLADE